jgi:hypothetical protein
MCALVRSSDLFDFASPLKAWPAACEHHRNASGFTNRRPLPSKDTNPASTLACCLRQHEPGSKHVASQCTNTLVKVRLGTLAFGEYHSRTQNMSTLHCATTSNVQNYPRTSIQHESRYLLSDSHHGPAGVRPPTIPPTPLKTPPRSPVD